VKRIFATLTVLCLIMTISYGQLTVLPSHPVNNRLEAIVQSLVGANVQVSNITSNLPVGSPLYGTFTEASGRLGIGNGLLMTSGSVLNAPGPNNTNAATTAAGLPGDVDLSQLVAEDTYDACVIEFDILTSSTEISFDYIFGSEEYITFVGLEYNDVFAFFLSGPGITGEQNIALIPGTTIPVSINNINPWANASFYRDNTNGNDVQYNGLTVKMKASAQVMPCQKYHLKLALADVFDPLYDSGVFIESGSLKGSDGLILGNGTVLAPDTVQGCASILPIPLKAGLFDLPNYLWTRNGAIVSTGKFYEAPSDGLYKVLAFTLGGGCSWEDSIRIITSPDFTVATSPDTSICVGAAAQLRSVATGSAGYLYQWSPAGTLSDPSLSNPIATPVATTEYSLTVTAGLCSKQNTVTVSIVPQLQFQATSAVEGCADEDIQLQASGAENYEWIPVVGLNNPFIANPLARIPTSRIYQVVGSNQCYRDTLEVNVTVHPFPVIQAYGDTTICYGGRAQLNADYFPQYQYSWTPANTLSDASIVNPLASPLSETEYTIAVDNHGCITTDLVKVSVREELKAQIVLPVEYGEIPWKLSPGNGSRGATEYTWYVTHFDSTKLIEPGFDIHMEDKYTIILKAVNDLGCYDYDTVIVTAYNLTIPNLITPNQDGKNDSFEITGIGEEFGLEVYNKWGDRVYKKSNYKNEWNAEGLNDGIYYFMITDSYISKDYKGWVQVIR
jgi:gliding motility-associated-like protein